MVLDFIVGILGQEYLTVLIVMVVAIVAAKVVQVILAKYIHRLTAKTKTDIDDQIIAAMSKPIYIIMILFGVNISMNVLSILAPYQTWITNIFYILYVFIIATVASRIVRVLIIRALQTQKKFEKTPKLLSRIISILVYLIALLVIMGYFGVELTGAIAALGLGGLAIGLALQETLSNFFAGLHIISDRPINVGDYIDLGADTKGYVEDIGWRSTRLRTLGNTLIIVPNAKLADSTIINKTMPDKPTSVIVKCGVGYGEDLKKAEKVTLDVARHIQKTIDGAVKDHEPLIRFNNFGDSNIDFSVILRAEEFTKKYVITHEFIKALKKRFDKEKIEISWPVVKVVKGK